MTDPMQTQTGGAPDAPAPTPTNEQQDAREVWRVESAEDFYRFAEDTNVAVIERDDLPSHPVTIWTNEDGDWFGIRPVSEDDLPWDDLPPGVRRTLAMPVDGIVPNDDGEVMPFTVLWADGRTPLAAVSAAAPDERALEEQVAADLNAAGIMPWTNGGQRIIRTVTRYVRAALAARPAPVVPEGDGAWWGSEDCFERECEDFGDPEPGEHRLDPETDWPCSHVVWVPARIEEWIRESERATRPAPVVSGAEWGVRVDRPSAGEYIIPADDLAHARELQDPGESIVRRDVGPWITVADAPAAEDCARCDGSGEEPDPDPHDERFYRCSECGGTGERTHAPAADDEGGQER